MIKSVKTMESNVNNDKIDAFRLMIQEFWPGFEITRNEMLHPNIRVMSNFLEHIFMEFQININEQFTRIFELNSECCYFSDLLYVHLLCYNVNQIYRFLGLLNLDRIEELRITDLLKPNELKLRWIILMLTNFFKYFLHKQRQSLAVVKNKVMENVKNFDSLQNQLDIINKNLEADELSRLKLLNLAEQNRHNKSKLLSKLEKASSKSQKLNDTIKFKQVTLSKLEQRNTELEKSLEETMKTNSDLKQQIVSNDGDIFNEREELKKKLEDTQIKKKELREKIEQKQQILDNANRNDQPIKTISENIKKIHEIYKLLEHYQNNSRKYRKSLDALATTNSELNKQINLLNEQKNLVLANIEKAKEENETKLKEMEEKTNQLDSLKDDYCDLNNITVTISNSNDKIRHNIQSQQDMFQKFLSLINQKMEEYLNTYKDMVHELIKE